MRLFEQIFYDIKLQEKFEKDGWVILPKLLTHEIEFLIHSFEDLFNKDRMKDESGVLTSIHDYDLRPKMRKDINYIFEPIINKHLVNYEVACGFYFIKRPGPKGVLSPHQDATIVDETKSRSLNIWCPLTDVSENNGALQILSGSHNLNNLYRAPTIPYQYYQNFPEIAKKMQTISMRKGDILLFDYSIVHGSNENFSPNNRVAVTLPLFPKSVPMIHFYKNENGDIEWYEVSKDFFMNYDYGTRPKNSNLIKTINKEEIEKTRNSSKSFFEVL